MAKVKLKMLAAMSGANINYLPQEVVEFDEATAVRLVDKGLAEFVNEKDKKRIALKIKNDLADKIERTAKVKALEEKERFEGELDGLYRATVLKEFEYNGVVPDEKQIEEAYKNIKERDAVAGSKAKA